MQSVRNRPIQTDGRPAWVSAGDWLLIQERAREIATERQAVQRARSYAVPLADPDDLDYAWERDNSTWSPKGKSLGGPQPHLRPSEPVPKGHDREKMDRSAHCNTCGHQYRTYALEPCCSRCNSKALALGPWEPRKRTGTRPATCGKCGYKWHTASLGRPSCSGCGSKAIKLGKLA